VVCQLQFVTGMTINPNQYKILPIFKSKEEGQAKQGNLSKGKIFFL
jgi:hypothetical protein